MGNSLVDGDIEKLQGYFDDVWREQKAFNWEKEFSEVLRKKGGVVIRNPTLCFRTWEKF